MEFDPQEIKPVITRMKRVNGHLTSVIRMLEEGADCEEVLTQFSAVNKALSRAGFALVAAGMQQCFAEAVADDAEVDIERMEKLFLSLA